MMDLVFNNLIGDKAFGPIFFKNILEAIIEELKLKDKNRGVSINLVSEARIKNLNKKYQNKNKVTDVLSFPMGSGADLGDIFICLPFAKKQAKSENISIEKEISRLTVHGFLHLLGCDHEKSEQDAQKMFKLENKILAKL